MSFASAEIVVDVLPGNDIFYMHPFSKGISIYNLAEVFQVKADKIYAVNKLNPTQPINDGRIVKIPFQNEWIVKDKSKISKKKVFVPVLYTVKKGDTAFKVCNQYFQLDPKSFLMLNDKKDSNIKLGEKLLLGWYIFPDKKDVLPSKENKEPNIQKLTNELKSKELISNKRDSVFTIGKKPPITKYYESDVIGWWDRSEQQTGGYFALHNEAKTGSTIDIYNPMMRNHVKAKVIGKIPSDTYHQDVQIILSSNVVKDLGILDSRYMVNVKFEK